MTARDVAVIREAADLIERMVGGYTVAERTARVMRLRAIAAALERGREAWELQTWIVQYGEPPDAGDWHRVLVIGPET